MRITEEQKQKILDRVKTDVEKNGSKNLGYVIYKVCGNWPQGSDDRHWLEELSGKLIEDGYYIRQRIKTDNSVGYTYQIFKNPGYEYLVAQKNTNRSTIALNKFLKRSNWASLIIAALTGIFIAVQTFKNSDSTQSKINEKILKELDWLHKKDSINDIKDRIIQSLTDSLEKIKKDEVYFFIVLGVYLLYRYLLILKVDKKPSNVCRRCSSTVFREIIRR